MNTFVLGIGHKIIYYLIFYDFYRCKAIYSDCHRNSEHSPLSSGDRYHCPCFIQKVRPYILDINPFKIAITI